MLDGYLQSKYSYIGKDNGIIIYNYIIKCTTYYYYYNQYNIITFTCNVCNVQVHVQLFIIVTILIKKKFD